MEPFYHALKVSSKACIGCTHCMTSCPTNAIRIRYGLATIEEAACVDCGVCLRTCPQHAIFVEQDDFNQIFNFKHRIVLVPTVVMGQFPEDITEEQIFSELHAMGFTHVIETDQATEILTEAMQEYIEKNHFRRPFISAFCPAIVRLIQVLFPSMLSHVIPLKQALDLSAIYARKKFTDKGIADKDIGVFYVTPCAAKIAAIKSPVGEEESPINGVINMDFIYNKVQMGITQHREQPLKSVPEQTHLSPEAIAWTLSEGEAARFNGRCLAIDEIHNVIDFLGKLEDDDIQDIDFIELRACDHSCVGGALTTNNRFLTIERLRKRMKDNAAKTHSLPDDILRYKDYLKEHSLLTGKVLPRSIEKLDENRLVAMEKMERINRIMSFIPKIDCGACGCPSCRSLAQDVVQGKAKLNQCVFMQKILIKDNLLLPDESIELSERTWGRNRFKK